MTLRVIFVGLLCWGLVPIFGEQTPPAQFPHGLGYSLSELTGLGFTYRFLDDKGGWQLSGVASNRSLVVVNGFEPELYSVGGAAGFTLSSFTTGDWFFSQLYLLVGGSWRSESYSHSVSTENPNYVAGSYLPMYYYGYEKRWRHVALVGPVLGIEAGLFQHFSFNLEFGYKAGYDFAKPNLGLGLILTPGISGIFFFRF